VSREDLRARLARGDILVGDGALGTLLMERGLPEGQPPEWFALERPEVLEEIASLYCEAGADLITTDTFGASPLRLALHGLEPATERINRTAVEAVRRAAADRAYVSASVGPTGRLLQPLGDADPEEVREGYLRQIGALAAAGADLICIETMTDLAEATSAAKAAKNVAPHLPVVATMTFDRTPRGFFTVMGVSVAQAVAGLADAGADVVGSNCGNGIETMVAVAEELARHTRLPIIIQPNAGLPETEGDRVVYRETPEVLAAHAPRLLDLGVSIVGGCCGTTPDHIRALRRVVDQRKALAALDPPGRAR
jgi:5-methyltetrahydrofolate--homocysteine methyltransferase